MVRFGVCDCGNREGFDGREHCEVLRHETKWNPFCDFMSCWSSCYHEAAGTLPIGPNF